MELLGVMGLQVTKFWGLNPTGLGQPWSWVPASMSLLFRVTKVRGTLIVGKSTGESQAADQDDKADVTDPKYDHVFGTVVISVYAQ